VGRARGNKVCPVSPLAQCQLNKARDKGGMKAPTEKTELKPLPFLALNKNS
jgi:hypothetical protein